MDKSLNLSEIIELRKFCIYCRCSPPLCKCNHEIKFVVWEEVIKSDIKNSLDNFKYSLLTKTRITFNMISNRITKFFGYLQ